MMQWLGKMNVNRCEDTLPLSKERSEIRKGGGNRQNYIGMYIIYIELLSFEATNCHSLMTSFN